MFKNEGVIVLAFGTQPISMLTKAAEICGKDAVADLQINQMIGASLVSGPSALLEEFRKALAPLALAHVTHQHPELSINALQWLANGERGVSSNTIFQRATGIKTTPHEGHPHDWADFRRCLLLLERVPEVERKFEDTMSDASPQWSKLIDRWHDIRFIVERDIPRWRDPDCRAWSDEAYDLIKSCTTTN